MAQSVKSVHGGLELPVAFCSPKDGRFLSARHSHSDCSITLSSRRGNDEVSADCHFFSCYDSKQVFTLLTSAQEQSTHLMYIRTSQRLYLSFGSSAWLIKQAVQLQRTKDMEASLREKQSQVRETLLKEAKAEKIARGLVEELETTLKDLPNPVANTPNYEREQQNRANILETLQKQLTAARKEYDRAIKPWRDAIDHDVELQRKIEVTTRLMQKISDFGCDCPDIERPLGAFLKPVEWRIHKSDGG